MVKDTQATSENAFAETAHQCADRILLHSKERMLTVKGAFESAHKAYMALALAASEAIKAFVTLDESLK